MIFKNWIKKGFSDSPSLPDKMFMDSKELLAFCSQDEDIHQIICDRLYFLQLVFAVWFLIYIDVVVIIVLILLWICY